MTILAVIKKGLLALTIVLFGGNAFAQQPESYTPVGSGHINDYANVINQPEEDQIREKLHEYQEKTSIEIAVVTVPSLGGMSIEEFANRLANHWGVGDREKDNGLVLLIAPVEGDVRLEVGDGLQGDLPDGASGAFLDRYMMPTLLEINSATNATEENLIFTKAAVAGVNGLVEYFGDKPYAQRLEERRLAEQKAAEEARLRAEQTKTFMMFAVPVVVVLVILGFIVARVAAKRRRERYLQKLFAKNGVEIEMASGLLTEAKDRLTEARQNLTVLVINNPRSAWEDIDKAVDEAPMKIDEQTHLLERLSGSHQSSSWHQAEGESKAVSALLATAAALAGLVGLAKNRGQEISDARSKSPGLASQYGAEEKVVTEVIGHKDVKDSTKQLLTQAREKYNEAVEAKKSQNGVNWLVVYALFTSAIAILNKAKSSAQADKRAAEEARRPKPVYRSSNISRGSTYRSSGGGMRIGGGGGFSGGGASRSFRR